MNDRERVVSVISKAETFLILTHLRPDGDAISSSVAMYEFLVSLGKSPENIDVFIPHISTDLFFIDKNSIRTKNCTLEKHDLVIVVDCSDSLRVEGNELLDGISPEQCILIDHHEAPGTPIKTDYSVIDTSAPSCTCIIYREFSKYISAKNGNSFLDLPKTSNSLTNNSISLV